MEKEECSISPEGLEQLLTIPEVAKLIGASYGQTAMILQRKRVPTRWATVEEEAMLLLAGRIEPVPPRPGFPPGARIKLIPREDALGLKKRKRADRTKGTE